MKIEASKFYTLGQMVEAQAFAVLGIKTQGAYRTAVIRDMTGDRILKAKITDSPKGVRGMRYKIKGSKILEYIKIHEKHSQRKK